METTVPHATAAGFTLHRNVVQHRYQIELDYSPGQFKSAKLKDKKYTINVPSFYTTLHKKERDLCTKFLTFVGRRSAVDLFC